MTPEDILALHTLKMAHDILGSVQRLLMDNLALVDEYLHRMKAKGSDAQWNESLRQHLERVMNEIEGLRRRIAELAPDPEADS